MYFVSQKVWILQSFLLLESVFLNSVNGARVLEEVTFKDLHVQPDGCQTLRPNISKIQCAVLCSKDIMCKAIKYLESNSLCQACQGGSISELIFQQSGYLLARRQTYNDIIVPDVPGITININYQLTPGSMIYTSMTVHTYNMIHYQLKVDMDNVAMEMSPRHGTTLFSAMINHVWTNTKNVNFNFVQGQKIEVFILVKSNYNLDIYLGGIRFEYQLALAADSITFMAFGEPFTIHEISL